MKKKKVLKHVGEALSEALAEIVLTLVFAAVGFGILKLLDIDLEFDPELFAGIGILIFAAVCAVVFVTIHLINKKRKKSHAETKINNDLM